MRSLKFRSKMRKLRIRIFGDAFHKQDRSIKSINKVLAAKRRQRDGKGKFNLEASTTNAANGKATSFSTTTVYFNTYEAEKSHADEPKIMNSSAIESSIGSCSGKEMGDQETWHGEERE